MEAKSSPKVNMLLEKEQRLASYDGEDRVISFQEKWDMLQAEKKVIHQIHSQIPGLDKLIDGFESGELIVLSGPTKSGKSVLLSTLTYAFGLQEIYTLWFSYELTPRQFLSRFPGAPVMPMSFLPARMTKNTLDWIEDRIVEAKIKHSCRVVMIDHLGYVADQELGRAVNISLTLGMIVRKIKRMAVRHNIIIFLVQHIEKIKEGDRPSYHHIRDSGLIACEADKVLMLWRIKDDEKKGIENQATLSVELDRRTGIIKKEVSLIFANQLLGEVEKKQKEKG